MQESNFNFFFRNLDTVFKNSTQKKSAKIWQIKRDGIRAKTFEAERIVLAAVVVVDVKAS